MIKKIGKKYYNVGKKGKHGGFKTRKGALKQLRAMGASGYFKKRKRR